MLWEPVGALADHTPTSLMRCSQIAPLPKAWARAASNLLFLPPQHTAPSFVWLLSELLLTAGSQAPNPADSFPHSAVARQDQRHSEE